MTPIRAKMRSQRPRERLAPKTQAVCHCDGRFGNVLPLLPRSLRPEQIRLTCTIAWSSATAPGVLESSGRWARCFSTKPLGWDVSNLPPRTGRSQLPQGLSGEALQRLFTSAKHPRHRVLLMTPYAAGLRVSDVVRLRLTDSASARRLLRVEQGKGRKERSTLLSTRLRTALRADGQCDRPAPWVFTGRDPHTPMPLGTAQNIS